MEDIPEDDPTFVETVRETVAGEAGEGTRLEAIEDSIPTEGGEDNEIFNAAQAEAVIELHGLECLSCGHTGTLDDDAFTERDNALGNARSWSGSHLYFYVACDSCGANGQLVIEPDSYDDPECTSLGYYETEHCSIKLNEGERRTTGRD